MLDTIPKWPGRLLIHLSSVIIWSGNHATHLAYASRHGKPSLLLWEAGRYRLTCQGYVSFDRIFICQGTRRREERTKAAQCLSCRSAGTLIATLPVTRLPFHDLGRVRHCSSKKKAGVFAERGVAMALGSVVAPHTLRRRLQGDGSGGKGF